MLTKRRVLKFNMSTMIFNWVFNKPLFSLLTFQKDYGLVAGGIDGACLLRARSGH